MGRRRRHQRLQPYRHGRYGRHPGRQHQRHQQSIAPIISHFALQFTSFEFFLLAFFGILISGTLTSPDLVIKGWIAGFLGLFLACVGRDLLQFYPRFNFGYSELDSGIGVVPVLISGALKPPRKLRYT